MQRRVPRPTVRRRARLAVVLLTMTGLVLAACASPRVASGPVYASVTCPGRGTSQLETSSYLPKTSPAAGAPVIVLIHGGGFTGGTRDDDPLPAIARELAAHGWATFSIDYCLPPDGVAGYPVQEQNVTAAIRYLVTQRLNWKLNMQRLVLWGSSSGAALAVDTAARRPTQVPGAKIVAAVGWSGPYDFAHLAGLSDSDVGEVNNYLGCDTTAAACKSRVSGASAVDGVTHSSAPMFLANSTAEEIPILQLRNMTSALQRVKVTVQNLVVTGSQHATDYTHTAYCPTVAFLSHFLGSYGACAPPA